MRAFIIGLALVAGCGGGDAADPLVGDWMMEQGSCVFGPTFSADQTYAIILVCALTDGSTGAEVEAGTYSTAADQLTTVPTRATCLEATAATVQYKVSANQLLINNGAGLLSFTRKQPSPPGGGVATLGCFQMGKFTPRPITPT